MTKTTFDKLDAAVAVITEGDVSALGMAEVTADSMTKRATALATYVTTGQISKLHVIGALMQVTMQEGHGKGNVLDAQKAMAKAFKKAVQVVCEGMEDSQALNTAKKGFTIAQFNYYGTASHRRAFVASRHDYELTTASNQYWTDKPHSVEHFAAVFDKVTEKQDAKKADKTGSAGRTKAKEDADKGGKGGPETSEASKRLKTVEADNALMTKANGTLRAELASMASWVGELETTWDNATLTVDQRDSAIREWIKEAKEALAGYAK